MTAFLGLINKINMKPGADISSVEIKDGRIKRFALPTLPIRIVLPVSITIILFLLTIFLIMVPKFEESLMDDRGKSIVRLTESAWSTLDFYYQQSLAGKITPQQAQSAAIKHLRRLRYGPELEDYFWIIDLKPEMVMHPYRRDLEGQNVKDFKDPSGKYLFREMVGVVKNGQQGFVDYLWQWKGNAQNIVPKLSYVKEFKPWGWVVGTGIYVEDVRHEILAITRHLTYTCSGIMVLFLLTSWYIIRSWTRSEKDRLKAMTEARIREQQLMRADRMASLGVIAAGVAHEVNNPVTTILLNAPNLKKAWAGMAPLADRYFRRHPDEKICNMPYPDLKSRVPVMLDSIEDSALRIRHIVSELKDFSQPSRSDHDETERFEEVDIEKMILKSIDLSQAALKKSGAAIQSRIDPDLPHVMGQARRLEQVMINLLVNAAQASGPVDGRIWVSAENIVPEKMVRIFVQDNGPGVPKDLLTRISDPFFTTKRDEGGSGLGLSISEKIVREHGGTIRFEQGNKALETKGLTVIILLPSVEKEHHLVLKGGRHVFESS